MSATMILAGVLVPLDVPRADVTNFAGYVLWSLWLVALGIRLARRPAPAALTTA